MSNKTHKIKLGSLVEVKRNGIRLFVVHTDFDCEGTPIYFLSHNKDDYQQKSGFVNYSWTIGYPEDSLKVISLPEDKKVAAR